MKKILSTLIIGLLFLSCSSDDSSGPALSNTPQAKAEFDNSNYGIYKGVFVGSSGTVTININNEGTVSATLTINGSTSTYTTQETLNLNTNVTGLTFTSGGNSFDLNVNSDGSNPTIDNIYINGHPNASITVLKELSNALVVCYLGTFSGDDSGVFNIIAANGYVSGLAKSNQNDQSFSLIGAINTTNITGGFEGGEFMGTVNGINISGSWSNTFDEGGNWSGKRKL